jgi:hypothetical protein
MSTKNTTTLVKAADLIHTEVEAGPREFETTEDLAAYVAECDRVIAEAREVKRLYAKKVAVIASQRSREARKARVAKALELLAEQEAAQAK